MKCDTEILQQFLDGTISPANQQSVETHLNSCQPCQQQLGKLKQNRAEVSQCLGMLEPSAGEVPEAVHALARYRARITKPSPNRLTEVEAALRGGFRAWFYGWRRAFALGMVSVLCLTALLSSASVRHMAAQWLSVFRVRTFAVIPVDPAQMERLSAIENLAQNGFLGQPEVLRQPDRPHEISSLEDASAVAGFTVRPPSAQPVGMELDGIMVQEGPALRYEVQRTMIQAVLDAMGVHDVPLPQQDTLIVEADLQPSVIQKYRSEKSELEILQMPSPKVQVTPAVDPAVLGRIALRLLGMPRADSERLLASVDWTSTLLIPLPTSVAQFREVSVDGEVGILIEETTPSQWRSQARSSPHGGNRTGFRHEGIILWQRDGMVYTVHGRGIRPMEMLRVADSLQ